MKKQTQDQEPKQVHMDDTAAAPAQETYSLEDIMNEFGGWSKKPEPQAPEKPEPPEKEPEAAENNAAPEGKTQADTKPAPAAHVQSNVVQMPLRTDGAEKAPKPPKNPADFAGQTIRFTPIREEQAQPAEKPKIWTYQAEPAPQPAPPDNPREAKKAARLAARAEKDAQRRQKQLERHQKRQARRLSRRTEQPDRTFASCREAYAFYAKGSFLRLRLFLSVLLTLASAAMLYFGNFTLGGYDFRSSAQQFSVAMLVLMLVQVCLSYDVLAQGAVNALKLRYDHVSMLLLLVVICTIDSVFAIRAGRIPFCPAVSLELMVALWGEDCMHLAKCRTLMAAASMAQPKAAVREEKAWHGEDCIFRSAADADAFATQLELPDAGRRMMRVYAPVMTVLTLGFSILSMLRAEENFLWAWTAMLLASFPAGLFLSFARPFAAQAWRLSRAGAAVAGWYGARVLGGECGIAIEDADLFPPQNVTLNGMKIYSDRSSSQIIGYANAVVQTAGSGLVPLFEEIMHNQNGRHYAVDTFRRYEGGGLGAEIRGDVILMGSLGFMKLMRVHMPEGARVKQAVYLSINAELAAVFALSYAPASNVKASLQALARCAGLTPILATRDFMITPQFLKHRYKISPDRIEFPTVEERARLSSPEAVHEPQQGALLARESFGCFAAAVAGARTARSAAIAAMVVALMGGVMGLLVLFFLTFIGSTTAVSAWNLLVYALLWLLPGVLITSLIGRR